jgi:putative membrane protein insertion efficiency factor
VKYLLMVPVRLWQLLFSSWLPRTCRFHPSCSQYALDALRERGAVVGLWLTVRRLLRCQPFCEPGFDPVPPRQPPGRTR